MNVVILDRTEVEPDYCVHGRVTCAGCGEWLWLGPETFAPVKSGAILPACRGCIEMAGYRLEDRIGRIEDRGAH